MRAAKTPEEPTTWDLDVKRGNCFNHGQLLFKNTQSPLPMVYTKLSQSTVRKKCSSGREKLLKFEAEHQEFAKVLRSLEQFIQTVQGLNNCWLQNAFLLVP